MSKAVALFWLLPLLTSAALQAQDDSSYQPFSPDQLENLLASIALYPDPLLAQILAAATFPDQIDEAARFCRAQANPNSQCDGIDDQPWDSSIKSVAHYPPILYMMADNLDWTTALGQAYVNQPDDVMAAVQQLRRQAQAAGNLVTTPQQEVMVDGDGNIDILPAQPQYCYLPTYDPALAFFGSGGIFGGPVVGFGPPFSIGVWLNYGINWRLHRIYYPNLPGGSVKNVPINSKVTHLHVNYANLTRYDSVHAEVRVGQVPSNVNNKIIERNTNSTEQRIDAFRGRAPEQAAQAPAQPERTATPPPPHQQFKPSGETAFGGNRGNFAPKVASQRGQTSRAAAPHVSAPSFGGGFHGGGGAVVGGGGGARHR
jgi:Protein of unknown function (DUF3300)